MEPQKAYDLWASFYDTNENKTRDLEAVSMREILLNLHFGNILEIGCGTGKNTEWLVGKAQHVTAIDLSENMLAKAREKIKTGNVQFLIHDINKEWTFTEKRFDLVTFSLVLEHIEDLDKMLQKTSSVLNLGGIVYIGELHPFKQYTGSKARLETESGTDDVTCYMHHLSDFTRAATCNNFEISEIREYFDEDNHAGLPRILSILLRKMEKS
jgi:ubiquinone/menaquinone biosynthesis C-methylase UbiE